MPPRRRRTLQEMLGAHGISGSAVVPGSEQTFIPVPGPRRKKSLYDMASGRTASRRKALGSPQKYRLEIGIPYKSADYKVGKAEGGKPDPTVVIMKRKGQAKKNDWMQNQKVMNVVLGGLKAKGAVDAEGNPQQGVKRKKLTKRERALYNRLRLTGKM